MTPDIFRWMFMGSVVYLYMMLYSAWSSVNTVQVMALFCMRSLF